MISFFKRKEEFWAVLVAFSFTALFFQNCAPTKLSVSSPSQLSTLENTRESIEKNMWGQIPQNLDLNQIQLVLPGSGSSESDSKDSVASTRHNGEVTLAVAKTLGFGVSPEDLNQLYSSTFTTTESGVICRLYARRQVKLGETVTLKLVALNLEKKVPSSWPLSETDTLRYNTATSAFDLQGKALIKGSSNHSEEASKRLLVGGNYIWEYQDSSLAGSYSRYVEIVSPTGQVICRTNTVQIQLLAANEEKAKPINANCIHKDIEIVSYYTQWPAKGSLCTGSRLMAFKDNGTITSVGVQAIYDFMDQDISQLTSSYSSLLSEKQSIGASVHCASGRALVSAVKNVTNSGLPQLSQPTYFDERFQRQVSATFHMVNYECVD